MRAKNFFQEYKKREFSVQMQDSNLTRAFNCKETCKETSKILANEPAKKFAKKPAICKKWKAVTEIVRRVAASER